MLYKYYFCLSYVGLLLAQRIEPAISHGSSEQVVGHLKDTYYGVVDYQSFWTSGMCITTFQECYRLFFYVVLNCNLTSIITSVCVRYIS